MKRKFLVLLALTLTAFSLTGCMTDDQIPELSEDEMYQVEEYAAQLLLQHNKYYSDGTLSEEEIERQENMLQQAAATRAEVAAQKAEQAAATADASSNGGGSGTSEPAMPVYSDIDEFLEMNSFDIECVGYTVCDTYPVDTSDNDWQGMATATNGNKLVVFDMQVINKTDSIQNFDMASKDIRASINVNGSIKKSPLTTLLLNDFLMYRGDFEAGENQELVIIVELSEDDAQNITSATLTLKYDGRRMETSVL